MTEKARLSWFGAMSAQTNCHNERISFYSCLFTIQALFPARLGLRKFCLFSTTNKIVRRIRHLKISKIHRFMRNPTKYVLGLLPEMEIVENYISIEKEHISKELGLNKLLIISKNYKNKIRKLFE